MCVWWGGVSREIGENETKGMKKTNGIWEEQRAGEVLGGADLAQECLSHSSRPKPN